MFLYLILKHVAVLRGEGGFCVCVWVGGLVSEKGMSKM